MSESKWIEHYRAGAWTVGEVIEAGAAWIVAMDPDHYRAALLSAPGRGDVHRWH